MDHRTFKCLFQGLWSFTREVRTLNSQTLTTSVQDGCASFVPWIHPDKVATSCYLKNDSHEQHYEPTWLLYRENGTVQNHDPKLALGTFTRIYLYDFSSKDAIKVYLCEPSNRDKDILDSRNLNLTYRTLQSFKLLYLFHNLEFKNPESMDNGGGSEKSTPGIVYNFKNLTSLQCVHPCEQDMYHGIFDILDGKNYTSLWKVTGPQKSYQILTKYSKDG